MAGAGFSTQSNQYHNPSSQDQVELKRKRDLPGPDGDIPQALAGGWKYSPTGDLPDIKASFQTTVPESAELASEQVVLLLRSFPIM